MVRFNWLTRTIRFLPVFGLLATWLLGAASLRAQCARVEARSLYFGETIGVLFDASVNEKIVRRAIGFWSRCSNYSDGFPEFLVGQPGSRNVHVVMQQSVLGPGKCGSFTGNRIELFERMVDHRGRVSPCGSIPLNLAHELGHVLGLDDAPLEPGCRRQVMSWIDSSNAFDRRVHKEECLAVGQTWLTDREWKRFSFLDEVAEVRRFTQGREWR